MSLPSDFERKEWWFYIYARRSFEHSLQCCELIQTHIDSMHHPLNLPLATAMHAFYGRPFSRINGINKPKKGCEPGPDLPPDFIPDKFLAFHRMIMTFRDKGFVHTDADPFLEAGRPMHNVSYTVRTDGDEFSTNEPSPSLGYYEKASELLHILIPKSLSRIDLYHDRFGFLVPNSPGDYQLNLTGPVLFTEYQELPRIWTFET